LTSIERLTAHLNALRTLHEVSKAVHASLDLGRTLDAVVRGVTKASGFQVALINLRMPDGDFEVVSIEGTDDAKDALLGTRTTPAAWDEIFGQGERWGALVYVPYSVTLSDVITLWTPDTPVPEDPLGWHPEDCLFAPLTGPGGDLLGVLSVDLPQDGRRPGLGQREILEMFAEHAAIAIQHANLHKELEESRRQLDHAANHDPLTGLANRARLRTFIDAHAGDATEGRRETTFGALVVDLDGFKRVNDEGGHEVGDEVLRVVAERMRRLVRADDMLARIGGDEFIVVLAGPEGPATLAGLADRMAEAIAEPIPTRRGPQRVGVSIGQAFGAGEVGPLLNEADADMYRVKQQHHRERDLRLHPRGVCTHPHPVHGEQLPIRG
jgi:diguanylate cyclase (GGDEF)-like protein